jgi:hypothetical protein
MSPLDRWPLCRMKQANFVLDGWVECTRVQPNVLRLFTSSHRVNPWKL